MVMADPNLVLLNATSPILEPYLQTVGQLVNIVGLFVGGIFGFYILSFIWFVYSYRKNRAMLKGLREDITEMKALISLLSDEIKDMKKGAKKQGRNKI